MTDFDERMAKLRTRFLDRIAADGAGLRLAERAADTAAIRRIAHGLAGSAGIFGFPTISSAALAVEQAGDEELRPLLLQLLQLLQQAPRRQG